MDIYDPTRGLGVEPSDPKKVENSIPNENNQTEQNSMESLLGKEGLGLDFPKAGEIRQGVIAAVKENEILFFFFPLTNFVLIFLIDVLLHF